MIDVKIPAEPNNVTLADADADADAGHQPPSRTEQLLRERDALPAAHPGRIALRNRVIELNLGMTTRLARRYTGRGVSFDDLSQVAALALIGAVDRYDSSRANLFAAYAMPTILGSLKRHFRDATWAMRVPRATQELVSAVTAAVPVLNQQLGRTPALVDIAEYLDADLHAVVDAMGAYRVYRLISLNAPRSIDSDTDLGEVIGGVDRRYAGIDERLALRPMIAVLAPRHRRVLTLYYYSRMTQAEIAAEIGISQMHVSRLLKQALGRLRVGLLG